MKVETQKSIFDLRLILFDTLHHFPDLRKPHKFVWPASIKSNHTWSSSLQFDGVVAVDAAQLDRPF